jgi:hypothetical protein
MRLVRSPPPFQHDNDFISSLLFVDLEASGLSDTSYPTEFGICGLDLKPTSFLIKPRPEWENAEWSPIAQLMTGIGKDLLQAEGIDADLAGERIEEAMAGRPVASDNTEEDSFWLQRLKPMWMHEGLRTIKEFEKNAVYDLSRQMGGEAFDRLIRKARKLYPHPHRAGPDAMRMAAMFRFLIDGEFRQFIDQHP